MASLRRPLSTALAVLLLVGLLVLGIWLGGHRSDLPGFVRSAVLPNGEAMVVDEAIDKVASDYYRPISKAALSNASISGLVASLDDRFSHYLSPSEFRTSEQPPRFTGIGVVVSPNHRGLLLARVFASTPAANAGLKEGEVVVSVNGRKLEGLSFEASAALVKGLPGTQVKLTLEAPAADLTADAAVKRTARGRTREVTITRAVISEPVVATETRKVAGVKLGVVELAAFTDGSGAEVREGVEHELHMGARGLVFDLRSNGGGLVVEAQRIASIFIPSGVIVTTRGRSQPTDTLRATGGAISTAIPVVVLVDENTASASEIVTAALQDHGRATVVGTHTFGKGVYQEQEPLENGGALDITVGEYFTPDGRNLGGGGVKQGAGVQPEVLLAKSVVDSERGLADALNTLVKKVK